MAKSASVLVPTWARPDGHHIVIVRVSGGVGNLVSGVDEAGNYGGASVRVGHPVEAEIDNVGVVVVQKRNGGGKAVGGERGEFPFRTKAAHRLESAAAVRRGRGIVNVLIGAMLVALAMKLVAL